MSLHAEMKGYSRASYPVLKLAEHALSMVYSQLHLSLMQVLVKGAGDRRHQTQVITKGSGLKTLATSVGRKNRASIARQVMKDRKMKTHIVDILAKRVQKEMAVMCSKKTSSTLRSAKPEALENFSWDTLVAEVETHAPTLLQVLRGIADVKHRVRKGSKPKLKSTRPSNTAVVGVCAAILLRHGNVHTNLLQKMVSLLLSGGHASKQVHVTLSLHDYNYVVLHMQTHTNY